MDKLFINGGYELIDYPETFLQLVNKYMGEDSEEYCRNLISDENYEERLYECQNKLDDLQNEYDEQSNQLDDLQHSYDNLQDELDSYKNFVGEYNLEEEFEYFRRG